MEDIIWCASFDIGKKNFSFYIEEMNINSFSNLSSINRLLRYNVDGSPTVEMSELLNRVFLNGKKILLKNSDITNNCEKGKYLDPELFHNMTDLLDSYKEYWDRCSIIVIEQQMSFGKKNNTMALKLGQHCYSYFQFNYGRFKEIVEYPSYYKTQILGAKKEMKKLKNGKITYKAVEKNIRKKWSVEKALEILHLRGDNETIDFVVKQKKKDDICDVITQLQSYKFLKFIEKIN